MCDNAWIIGAITLLSFIVIVSIKKHAGWRLVSSISIGAIALSFVLSVATLIASTQGQSANISFVWVTIGSLQIHMGFMVDPLTAIMLVVITFVSMLVQIYSLGYMHGDPRLNWFYAVLSLFTTSMLGLVLANNYLGTYMFWELVGLCSYLLIGFWYEKKAASGAAKKAFIVTRAGDVGFFIGIALLFWSTKTFDYNQIFHAVETHSLGVPILTAIGILLFMGAAGKSAQFPFHVWLPDAMEGPTPVSALIHAATMVAAGVFLVARSYPIYEAAPIAMQTVAVTGSITALMAALIAVGQNDIKKILAYSTISQLGYMMMAMGVGSMVSGMFHLMTHAFFKALLFLGAGSVIHATHSQDITEMGGLFKDMKITATTFIIGTLALTGIPPFAGFWSKDEIVAAAFESGNYWVYGIGTFAALLTSFYMFRLVFLTFFGKPRKELHAHESPTNMTIPLILLAFLAVVAGLANSPFTGSAFGKYLMPEEHLAEANLALMAIAVAVAFTGIFFAWLLYFKNVRLPEYFQQRFAIPRNAVLKLFWFEDFYVWTTQIVVLGFARAVAWNDRVIIGAIVDGTGFATAKSGQILRRIQTGYLQTYLLMIAITLAVCVWVFM